MRISLNMHNGETEFVLSCASHLKVETVRQLTLGFSTFRKILDFITSWMSLYFLLQIYMKMHSKIF